MGQAREIMDRMTNLAVTQRDVASAVQCYADNAVVSTPDAGKVTGRDDIAGYWGHFIAAFPDSAFEYEDRHEAGDAAIDEGYFVGTNTGPMTLPTGEELPPTGRKVRIRSCDVATVRDGKITEHHLYFDQADFMSQLGLAPETGS